MDYSTPPTSVNWAVIRLSCSSGTSLFRGLQKTVPGQRATNKYQCVFVFVCVCVCVCVRERERERERERDWSEPKVKQCSSFGLSIELCRLFAQKETAVGKSLYLISLSWTLKGDSRLRCHCVLKEAPDCRSPGFVAVDGWMERK